MLLAKQKALLRQLKRKIYTIKYLMLNEGLTLKDINNFIHQNIFKIQFKKSIKLEQQHKQLKRKASDSTEQETNTEDSQIDSLLIQMSLQNSIIFKLKSGQNIHEILLEFNLNCCQQQEKLKNYLKAENCSIEVPNLNSTVLQRNSAFNNLKRGLGLSSIKNLEQNSMRNSVFNYDKMKIKLQPKKYISCNSNEREQNYWQNIEQSSIPNLNNATEYLSQSRFSTSLNQSERQFNYISSFEKTLYEGIKKTKLLRSLLEKKFAGENFRNEFRNEQIDENEEIY